MNSHVFVIDGDLRRVACDAWLLPVDDDFHVEDIWIDRASGVVAGSVPHQAPWEPDERVRPWRSDDRGLDPDRDAEIWLGRMGSYGRSASWYAEGVAQFVRAAANSMRRTGGGRAIPLLGINLVGTGAGGAFDRKGDILVALFAALYQVLDSELEGDVDVVVVCWGERPYGAAQRARFLALAGGVEAEHLDRAVERWAFEYQPERLWDAARRLAFRARRHELALFIGAGVSAGAGLPTWDALLRAVARRGLNGQDDVLDMDDPRDQAALLQRRLARVGLDLHHEVAELLDHQRYSLAHGLVSSLPSREVITTNFDAMFETSSTTAGRSLSVLPDAPNSEARRWLLKLHGSVTQPQDMVFTRANYVEAPRRRGALFGLVQAMLLTRHMLFVGYSLRDEDFHEVLHDVRQALPKSERSFATAITLFDDPLRSELWSGEIDVLAMRPPTTEAGPDVQGPARDVERFLDLVGFLAANCASFILDPSYKGMLTGDEERLTELVAPILAELRHDEERNGWDRLIGVFDELGWPSGADLSLKASEAGLPDGWPAQ